MLGFCVAAVTTWVGSWLWATPYRKEPIQVTPIALPLPASAPARPVAIASQRDAGAAPQAPAKAAQPARKSPALPTGMRTFLLVGLDRRADGRGPALADTLVVAVMNEGAGALGLVSVPRDLYVEIPAVGFDRINTVYNVGRRTKVDPLRLLARVVSDTLKLPIEHAIAIDLGVFERGIDALGGVEVEVPCPIVDRFIDSRVPGGRRVLDVGEGAQRMDGATAAMYVRSRHGRSDWNRARRQQAVLLGLRGALETLGGLSKLPALWDAVEDSVHTDLRRIELLSLARKALSIEPQNIHGLVLGATEARAVMTSDGRAVLMPDFVAIERALAGLFSAPSPGAPLPNAKCAAKDAALRVGAGS